MVRGKGAKERKAYFDARTKIHLKAYLDERNDGDEALFVSLTSPCRRLAISGVEQRLKKLGDETVQQRVHPPTSSGERSPPAPSTRACPSSRCRCCWATAKSRPPSAAPR